MTATGTISYGMTLNYSTDLTRPPIAPAFAPIIEIRELPLPAESTDIVDSSTHSSTINEDKIPGIRRLPGIDVVLKHDHNDATLSTQLDILKGFSETRTIVQWELLLNDGSHGVDFDGFVSQWAPDTPREDLETVTMTITPSDGAVYASIP